jgi:restriction endonuclease S subunit
MSKTSYRLGELTRVLRGRIPATTVTDQQGPRFFGIAEISARGRAAKRYVERGISVEDAVILNEGDVVVALLGNVGDAALVDDINAGAVLGRECVAFRVTAPDALRPAWLSAWMSSEECRSQVAHNTSGTTMPRLAAKALTDFTVALPPLEEQVEIEELVSRFDTAIATTATTLQQLENLRRAELQLAMGNQ